MLAQGGSMPHYRLDFLDEHNKITAATDVSAENDEEACAAARQLERAHDIEVWQQARKVATIGP